MPKMMKAPILVAALTITLGFARTSAAAAPKKAPDGVEFTADVVYGKGGGEDLKLNLSRPKKSAGKLPCILVIHGGGWAGGDRAQHDDLTWNIAQRGYVSATVGYRLAPAHRFPAQVEDVKCAVRFLRAHAGQYGIDPDRIGSVGFSAGGHLSMMLGTTRKEDGLEGDGGWPDQSSKVQAVVSFFGPTDLAARDLPAITHNILRNFIGGTAAEKPHAYERASPIKYVRAGAAPMLLFQGTTDPLVPLTQATRMAEEMTKAEVEGRIEILVGLGHGWFGAELLRTAESTFAFFDKSLRKGEAKAASN